MDDNLNFLKALMNSCPTNYSSSLLIIIGVWVSSTEGRRVPKHGGHSYRWWVGQLLHHASNFLLASVKQHINYCSQCCLFNHVVPQEWDEAHLGYRGGKVGLGEATSNRGCRR
jgi:hypothetical protein